MKKITILCLLLVSLLFAQTTPENVILLFDGGKTQLDFTFYWQLLSGGQNIGFSSAEPWDVWSNPASLVSFKNKYIAVGIEPAILANPYSYTDVDATIEEEVDASLENYKTSASQIAYPKLDTKLGQQGGLYGFQLVYPVKTGTTHNVFSFDVGQPFVLDLNMRNNGLNTMIETRKELGDTDTVIRMRLNSLLSANVALRSTKYRVGWARQLSPRFVVGMGLGQTMIKFTSSIIANIAGIMETAGTEYAFNDPYDPRIDFDAGETNRLDQSVKMDFEGSGVNLDIGGLYRLSNSWIFGAGFSSSADVTIAGEMDVQQFKIPALNTNALMDSESEEDLVDPTKLNLAKLTLTEPVVNKIAKEIKVYMPSSFGIQLSYQKPIFETTFSWKNYFGQFGYEFVDEKQFLEMSYDLAMDFVWGFFKLSVGGIKGQLVQLSSLEEDRSEVWVPHGAVEISSYIFNSFYFSTKLFVEPTPGVGLKLGYFF